MQPPHTFPPRFPARTRMIMVRHIFSHSSNFNRTARAWQSPWAGTHCTHRVAPVRWPNEKISVILDAVVVLRLFSSPVLVPPCKEFPHGEVVYPSVGWSCMQLQRQPRDSSSCKGQIRQSCSCSSQTSSHLSRHPRLHFFSSSFFSIRSAFPSNNFPSKNDPSTSRHGCCKFNCFQSKLLRVIIQ